MINDYFSPTIQHSLHHYFHGPKGVHYQLLFNHPRASSDCAKLRAVNNAAPVADRLWMYRHEWYSTAYTKQCVDHQANRKKIALHRNPP